MRTAILVLVVLGAAAVMLTDIPAAYVFAPLLGLVILRFGFATFGSLQHGGAHIPDGPPEPVDLAAQRTVYWCAECGTEVLLLVKGTETAPRHCGEKMTERTEIPSEWN